MWLGKRFFDLTFSLFGLIILSPFFFIIAILIKLDSKGPVFFKQQRIGKNGKKFSIYKFRTMFINTEKNGLLITIGNDPRITRIGYWLRKNKIDEFPQLINVINSSMSIVGPRPEVPKYVAHYPKKSYEKIFMTKPGITDLASLKFKNENELLSKSLTPEKTYIEEILPQKIQFYESYIEQSSFIFDLKIIFETFKSLFC